MSDTATSTRLIGRWESRGGRYWVELSEDRWGYSYHSDSGGGMFRRDGKFPDNLDGFMARIARGDFQSDDNTTPMRKVK